jgi:hypothetical protein
VQAKYSVTARSAASAPAFVAQHLYQGHPGKPSRSLLQRVNFGSMAKRYRLQLFGIWALLHSMSAGALLHGCFPVQALVDKYGVREDELRVYIHYQPSYYHLHVHFLHVKYDAGAGMAAGKAHLLNDVIGRTF